MCWEHVVEGLFVDGTSKLYRVSGRGAHGGQNGGGSQMLERLGIVPTLSIMKTLLAPVAGPVLLGRPGPSHTERRPFCHWPEAILDILIEI